MHDGVFPGGSAVKNLPAVQETFPGSGRSPGGGHGSPLHYSCLESPLDLGAWWATVHRVTKSRKRLKQLSARCMNDTRYSSTGDRVVHQTRKALPLKMK